ncbi:MAG: hypothetical protein KA314_13530 [Chloroflexi bacterium]|nr:hypothetical protein [Chloroflexota bacterium]
MFDPYKTLGFTGTRHLSIYRAAAIGRITLYARQAGCTILVGCANGADAAVRAAAPQAIVLSVRDYLRIPTIQARLAVRSAALVTALVTQSPRSALVAFPGQGCPARLTPCRNPFQVFGPGTWATVAMAIHHTVPVFVFGTTHVTPPDHWGSWQRQYSGPMAGAYLYQAGPSNFEADAAATIPQDVDDRLQYQAATQTGIPCF